METGAAAPPGWEDILTENEEILWQGNPVQGLQAPLRYVFLSVFGLPFLAGGLASFGLGLFAVLGLNDSLVDLGGLFAIAVSLPFMGVGLHLVFGTWYRALTAHRHVHYTLTDRRAFIAKSYWKRTLDSYPIGPDSAVSLETGKTSDTVWFSSVTKRSGKRGYVTTKIGFEHIADGPRVFRMIRKAQERQTA